MTRPAPAPGINDKVAFLSGADAYADYSGPVAVVETHLSWVFLTDTRAYKLKKPVRRRLLDFSSIDGRQRNCLDEVRLNRRLGGDTYIGVEPIRIDRDGRLQLDGSGVIVDWLVVMHRLPTAAMLSHQIAAGRIDQRALEQVATRLSKFYMAAEPVIIEPRLYIERLSGYLEENRQALSSCWPEYHVLHGQQVDFLERRASLLAERATRGMVLEAHGDLRPEHICLTTPPVVIDCLEFSRDLRIQDRVDELSYLAMECDRLGASPVGEQVQRTYSAISGDRPPPALIAFYRCFRACLRARLCVLHLEDVSENRKQLWRQRVDGYLALAYSYAPDFGAI